jgi:hypothetical protein
MLTARPPTNGNAPSPGGEGLSSTLGCSGRKNGRPEVNLARGGGGRLSRTAADPCSPKHETTIETSKTLMRHSESCFGPWPISWPIQQHSEAGAPPVSPWTKPDYSGNGTTPPGGEVECLNQAREPQDDAAENGKARRGTVSTRQPA